MKNQDARKEVINAGIRLVKSGLTARTWGNISCRVDEDTMVITPSGRDYMGLKPEDLVEVKISDGSYTDKNKPSVEKNLHGEVYKLHPEAGFVIHTHQVNASVAGVTGEKEIKITGEYPLLGGSIVVAEYGIPGSKKLSKNVAEAVKISNGNGVLMKAHGAVCFGKNQEEAFETAMELEKACEDVICEKYMNLTGEDKYDEEKIINFALSLYTGKTIAQSESKLFKGYNSQRLKGGIMFYDNKGFERRLSGNMDRESLSVEERIHYDVYMQNPLINYINYSECSNTKAVSAYGINLRPLLDDFAQIAGTVVKAAAIEENKVVSALGKSSAVFIQGQGALCTGITRDDAEAVGIILEKTCKSLVGAALFNKVKFLGRVECALMRYIYINKYSKKKSEV